MSARPNPAQAPSHDSVDCSVLIPVLNEERYIERAVAAMQRQRFPGTLEFLFADGGSADRTRELLAGMARDDPRIRVLDNPRRSVSSGLNVALAAARGRWVARMDAHSWYPEDYIRLGVERLERGGTRWVSGPQVPAGDTPVSAAVELALRSRLGRGGSRKWGVDGETGAERELDSGVFCGVWERATLLEYSGWDERWPRNSDSELAARFIDRGERLVCIPAMGARYVPRGTLRGLWRQYLDYGVYRAKTAVHHPRSMRRSHLLPPALVAATALSVASPRPVRGPSRLAVAAYAAVLTSAGVRAVREQRGARGLLVPAVLAVMHYAHGTGFILGTIENCPDRIRSGS